MLRLSKLGDYGTVMMAHMAREPSRVFSAAEVAAAVGVGLPTVSKLLKILARNGLLVSHRGTKGGYTLARSPGEISIAQIIDAVEGTVGMTECSVTVGLCAQEPRCLARGSWLRINQVVRSALEGVRLAEFAQPVATRIDLRVMHAGRRFDAAD
ncbi:SUF system Fe-S cluster assembly regulator [Aromatoleum diolicum]|uniref:SUF system Fe-S cluster assembly regulator n=1 Tax=Aromatoleum diolicum TaxID=75796 RepID=A0ABX1QIL4_9RHOO|nr:SUF system Fe-S cluster assembly regulator [Aromatoleum diolicum]NMG76946.1 SUF system Fe-S cluster assembly regulator [Aromatoleum diolicum]